MESLGAATPQPGDRFDVWTPETATLDFLVFVVETMRKKRMQYSAESSNRRAAAGDCARLQKEAELRNELGDVAFARELMKRDAVMMKVVEMCRERDPKLVKQHEKFCLDLSRNFEVKEDEEKWAERKETEEERAERNKDEKERAERENVWKIDELCGAYHREVLGRKACKLPPLRADLLDTLTPREARFYLRRRADESVNCTKQDMIPAPEETKVFFQWTQWTALFALIVCAASGRPGIPDDALASAAGDLLRRFDVSTKFRLEILGMLDSLCPFVARCYERMCALKADPKRTLAPAPYLTADDAAGILEAELQVLARTPSASAMLVGAARDYAKAVVKRRVSQLAVNLPNTEVVVKQRKTIVPVTVHATHPSISADLPVYGAMFGSFVERMTLAQGPTPSSGGKQDPAVVHIRTNDAQSANGLRLCAAWAETDVWCEKVLRVSCATCGVDAASVSVCFEPTETQPLHVRGPPQPQSKDGPTPANSKDVYPDDWKHAWLSVGSAAAAVRATIDLVRHHTEHSPRPALGEVLFALAPHMGRLFYLVSTSHANEAGCCELIFERLFYRALHYFVTGSEPATPAPCQRAWANVGRFMQAVSLGDPHLTSSSAASLLAFLTPKYVHVVDVELAASIAGLLASLGPSPRRARVVSFLKLASAAAGLLNLEHAQLGDTEMTRDLYTELLDVGPRTGLQARMIGGILVPEFVSMRSLAVSLLRQNAPTRTEAMIVDPDKPSKPVPVADGAGEATDDKDTAAMACLFTRFLMAAELDFQRVRVAADSTLKIPVSDVARTCRKPSHLPRLFFPSAKLCTQPNWWSSLSTEWPAALGAAPPNTHLSPMRLRDCFFALPETTMELPPYTKLSMLPVRVWGPAPASPPSTPPAAKPPQKWRGAFLQCVPDILPQDVLPDTLPSRSWWMQNGKPAPPVPCPDHPEPELKGDEEDSEEVKEERKAWRRFIGGCRSAPTGDAYATEGARKRAFGEISVSPDSAASAEGMIKLALTLENEGRSYRELARDRDEEMRRKTVGGTGQPVCAVSRQMKRLATT